MDFERRKKDDPVLQLKFCGVNISLQNNKIQINGHINDKKENDNVDIRPTFSTFSSTSKGLRGAVVESRVIKVESIEEEGAETESDNEPGFRGMSLDDSASSKVFVTRADKNSNTSNIAHSNAVPIVEFVDSSDEEEEVKLNRDNSAESNHSKNSTFFTTLNIPHIPRQQKPRQSKPWTEKILSEEYLQKLKSLKDKMVHQREQSSSSTPTTDGHSANQHSNLTADFLQRPYSESLLLKKDRKKREGEGTSKTRSIDDVWMKRYNEVKAFKEQHGHFIIPQLKGHQFKVIYNWMNNQRTLYAKGKLSQEKIDKLNDLGFVWMTTRKRKRMETAHVKRVKKQKSPDSSISNPASSTIEVVQDNSGAQGGEEEEEEEDDKHTDANSEDESPLEMEHNSNISPGSGRDDPQVPEDETGDETMGQLEIVEETEKKEEQTEPMILASTSITTAD